MPLQLHWFLPTHGDGRQLARRSGPQAARATQRTPDFSYLCQVAGAADQLGFTSVLVPFGLFCEDPWLVTAAVARQTRQLKFMVAFRPGLTSPTLTAQMAATAQRLSGGRLLLNVVVGGDADEQRRYGDWSDHNQRYARAEEFLTVVRGAWSGAFDFDGDSYRVRGARVVRPPDPVPEVFLGGSSHAARQAAARHADVYLAWGEPPDRMAELVAQAREAAAGAGRQLRIGTRFHVISRDTAEAAWAEADALVAGLDPEMVAAAQHRFARSESEGQRRAAQLHGGGLDRLEVHPNVWAGYGLLRPGAGVALVGSHEDIADRLAEYHRLGLDDFILSGQPHVEEAYWFGEGVMPLLRERGLLDAGPTGAPTGSSPDVPDTAVAGGERVPAVAGVAPAPTSGPAAGVTASPPLPWLPPAAPGAAAPAGRPRRARVVALIGTPWPQSRTRTVAVRTATAIAAALTTPPPGSSPATADGSADAGDGPAVEPPAVVDLSELAPQLVWGATGPAVDTARDSVVGADVLLVASSTIKAGYSGLLKVFVDLLPRQALAGVVAVPLMTASEPAHAYVVDLQLRPLLSELGAAVPTPGLSVRESDFPVFETVLAEWLEQALPLLRAAVDPAVRP
jgi:alkanesulfonate monooxygenase